MKLTQEQIRDARRAAVESSQALNASLDAYQRVEVLLEQWHVGHDTCAWQDSMGPLYNELYHAMYGEE